VKHQLEHGQAEAVDRVRHDDEPLGRHMWIGSEPLRCHVEEPVRRTPW
jgi:hypothetical protein